MKSSRQAHLAVAIGTLALAAAASTHVFAGPLPVPTLQVFLGTSSKDGSTNQTVFQNDGPLHFVGATSSYNNQVGTGTNFASAIAGIKTVHVTASASVGLSMGLSPGQFNIGNAQAEAGFSDSVESPTVPVSAQFEWIADGTTSDSFGANDVSFGLTNDTNGRSVFQETDLGLGGSLPSLSSYPVSFWIYTVPLAAGVAYTFSYDLDVVAGAFCGFDANGSQRCQSGIADYFNTGGVQINELDAMGKPVAGNPDLIFASGLDYSTFSDAVPPPPTSVPEPGTLALLGIGLVVIGFSSRRKA